MGAIDVLSGTVQWAIDCSDVLDGLRSLPGECVHCVVTSPPYFALRDYGTATWTGGMPDCDHAAPFIPINSEDPGIRHSTLQGGKKSITVGRIAEQYRNTCGTCGAVRIDRQIGLEATAADYVTRMVEVFAEVKRVLRRDGTLWLNLGDSYKDKDLAMMPARVALALKADGWWLRSDIIFAKKSPMPESVTDRPTSAHEHVFLLSKASQYFYDVEAVKQATHNLRNVWHLSPEPFSDAHFATFPTEIPRRAILAGTSERGCCPACGAPWIRIVETSYVNPGHRTTNGPRSLAQRHETAGFAVRLEKDVQTTGWQPTCTHGLDPQPAVVLDPFAGSGTTLMVALRHGRRAIGFDLSPQYVELAERRISDDAPLFNRAIP